VKNTETVAQVLIQDCCAKPVDSFILHTFLKAG